MGDFSNGSKVTWRGEDFTILKTYNQPMVQMVNSDGFVRSVPLSQLVYEVMRDVTLRPTKSEG